MCLLESVTRWDEGQIACRANSHRNPDNPLRTEGREGHEGHQGQLGAAVGIEYAAQAMAVHGALLSQATSTPRQGYLVSVRAVKLHVDRLDELPGDLEIYAQRIAGDEGTAMYQFSIGHDGQAVMEGRASVVFDAERLKSGTP